jgi:hypothetical protein
MEHRFRFVRNRADAAFFGGAGFHPANAGPNRKKRQFTAPLEVRLRPISVRACPRLNAPAQLLVAPMIEVGSLA